MNELIGIDFDNVPLAPINIKRERENDTDNIDSNKRINNDGNAVLCPVIKQSTVKRKCIHNVDKYTCKECGGASICQHQRRRSRCKDCGGGSICQHQRRRESCKECKGVSMCPHRRQKSSCKECGGGNINKCPHQKQKHLCKHCAGS